jgi:hypothetical protein
MNRDQIPDYGALQMIAELESHGVTVHANGTVSGKPSAAQLTALKANREAVIAASKCKTPDKAMLAWLRICEVAGEGSVSHGGKTYGIRESARKLIDGYLFRDEQRWWTNAGAFWLAMTEGGWDAGEDGEGQGAGQMDGTRATDSGVGQVHPSDGRAIHERTGV